MSYEWVLFVVSTYITSNKLLELGFVFTTVVLHSETVGGHQITQNGNSYILLL